MYVPILFITLVLMIIFYGYLFITYSKNKKKLEEINNII